MPKSVMFALVGAAALLGSCAGGGAAEADSPTSELSAEQVAARYGYSLAENDVLPVYAIVPEFHDPRDGYARDLLAERCLADTIPYIAVAPMGEIDGMDVRTGQMKFDAGLAAQLGYPVLRQSTVPDTAVPDGIEISDSALAKMVDCGKQADERLGSPPERVINEIDYAGWDAMESSEKVAEAASRWKTCMQPVGVIDLPDSPMGMPSESIIALTGTTELTDGGGTPAPSPREREVAMADAACRESSGYTAAVFEAKRDGQLEAIGANMEEFEAARQEYITYAKGVDEVIAELG